MILEWKEEEMLLLTVVKKSLDFNLIRDFNERYFWFGCQFYCIYLQLLDSNWKTGWEVYFDKWGRDGNTIFYTVGNLEPETKYSFRVIAVNKMGASLASDATVALKTGKEIET